MNRYPAANKLSETKVAVPGYFLVPENKHVADVSTLPYNGDKTGISSVTMEFIQRSAPFIAAMVIAQILHESSFFKKLK